MNCFGGKIYQDLHRRYTSPTAGLFFTAEDFNKVLRDISVIRNPLIFTPPRPKKMLSNSIPSCCNIRNGYSYTFSSL